MSLEVKIPKEITDYREKIIFGMSGRQLLCAAISVIICTITYIAVNKFIGDDLAGYLVLAEAMPIMGVGFVRINGFVFEKYMMIIIRHKLSKQTRIYKTELSIDFFDYYSGFELKNLESGELVTKAKTQKYSRSRNEANQKTVARTKK